MAHKERIELGNACKEIFDEVGKGLRIQEVVQWIAKQLNKLCTLCFKSVQLRIWESIYCNND